MSITFSLGGTAVSSLHGVIRSCFYVFVSLSCLQSYLCKIIIKLHTLYVGCNTQVIQLGGNVCFFILLCKAPLLSHSVCTTNNLFSWFSSGDSVKGCTVLISKQSIFGFRCQFWKYSKQFIRILIFYPGPKFVSRMSSEPITSHV